METCFEKWKRVLNCISLFLIEAKDFFHLNTDSFCVSCLPEYFVYFSIRLFAFLLLMERFL